ncbi:MAG: non-ribosomal peptide synthetase, partial [Pyrinomonadaceae bacterium]
VSLAAYAHQDLPFERLVEELQPERDQNRQPIFQVSFAFQNARREGLQLEGLELSLVEPEIETAKFDLGLWLQETRDGFIGNIQYDTDLFDQTSIHQMLQHFTLLLEAIVNNPEERVSHLRYLNAEEQEQVLRQWNQTATEYPQQCIHELFEEQAEQTPEAIAVVYQGEQVTYRELNERANQLGHYLRGRGVGPEVIVGVMMERSVEMVVALLGILKAGGAYLPLDPQYPLARLSLMIEETAPPVILTQAHLEDELPATAAQVLALDREWERVAGESRESVGHEMEMENLAYVVYTSGSTGSPKGVMISQRAICNHMRWMQQVFPLTAEDRVLQKTPFSFDASVWEFYAPLLTGARLIMARPGGHLDAAYLVRLINEQSVTILQLVPSLLRVLLDDKGFETCRSLRRVFYGGEALAVELQERFFACMSAELHNLYGPTEATIDATFWSCRRDSQSRTIPIGRPIANTQTYVLDERLSPVPIGVPGELYIGGDGLARGYLKRTELTAERFVPHPYSREGGERLYRTGDVVRYLEDGNLEFIGRVDGQVKIRGYRVEVGEVEEVLRGHSAIIE